MDTEAAARLRARCGEGIDWGYLLSMAARHGVTPLVYCHLQDLCPEVVPTSWLTLLRERFHRNAQRNLWLASELVQILAAFEANRVPAIAYKGPVLAAAIYGNLALREFCDLDVLIPHGHLPEAREILSALGYWSPFDRAAAGRAAVGSPGQYQFSSADGEKLLELHTEITLRYFPKAIDLERIAARAQPVSIGGRTVRTASPEDLLLLLCVHGAKDFWIQLKWICDVGEILRCSADLNWSAVWHEAQRLGCRRMVLLGLRLAHELLATPLPRDIKCLVEADSAVGLLVWQVGQQLFQEAGSSPGLAERFAFRLRMRGNLMQGLRYCWRLGTSPTEEDWLSASLPGPLAPLCAALRPLRLLQKYGLGSAPRTSAN